MLSGVTPRQTNIWCTIWKKRALCYRQNQELIFFLSHLSYLDVSLFLNPRKRADSIRQYLSEQQPRKMISNYVPRMADNNGFQVICWLKSAVGCDMAGSEPLCFHVSSFQPCSFPISLFCFSLALTIAFPIKKFCWAYSCTAQDMASVLTQVPMGLYYLVVVPPYFLLMLFPEVCHPFVILIHTCLHCGQKSIVDPRLQTAELTWHGAVKCVTAGIKLMTLFKLFYWNTMVIRLLIIQLEGLFFMKLFMIEFL